MTPFVSARSPATARTRSREFATTRPTTTGTPDSDHEGAARLGRADATSVFEWRTTVQIRHDENRVTHPQHSQWGEKSEGGSPPAGLSDSPTGMAVV